MKNIIIIKNGMTDLIFQLSLYHLYYLYLKHQMLLKDHIEEKLPTYIFFNLIPIWN